MSSLKQLYIIFYKKILELKGSQGPLGMVREANGIFRGGGGVGGFGGPMNIIYKGVVKCYNKKIHQMCSCITFTTCMIQGQFIFCVFGGK
jgi:hypothetical protein